MIKQIWEYQTITIRNEADTSSVTFDKTDGTLQTMSVEFTDEYVRDKMKSGTLKMIRDGFRPRIEVSILIRKLTYLSDFIEMIQILNEGGNVLINTGSIDYDMMQLDSNITVEKINQLIDAGSSIPLVFIGSKLMASLPTDHE